MGLNGILKNILSCKVLTKLTENRNIYVVQNLQANAMHYFAKASEQISEIFLDIQRFFEINPKYFSCV